MNTDRDTAQKEYDKIRAIFQAEWPEARKRPLLEARERRRQIYAQRNHLLIQSYDEEREAWMGRWSEAEALCKNLGEGSFNALYSKVLAAYTNLVGICRSEFDQLFR